MSARTIPRSLAALVALVMVLVAAAPVRASEGSIEGQLNNGTADGPVPTGVTVVLHIVDDQERVERQTTTADEAGRYRFDGLSTSAGLRYLPVVEYQGALYFPRPIKLNEQPRQTADITLYEASSDDRYIAVERSNLMIQGIGVDRLDLMEMGAVVNVGDRSYTGPDVPPGVPRTTLRFSVPPNATELAPQFGFAPQDFAPAPGGFTISSPVVPGRHQLAFSYSLSTTGDRLEIAKRLEYPTQSFNLYLPDVGLRVDSPQLRPQGEAELGGQKYLLYSAQNLSRGTDLRIRLAGLPTPGGAAEQIGPAVMLGGAAALLVGVLMVYRRRFGAPQAVAVETNGHDKLDQVELERARLLVALARLDEQFERGELPPERYEREREVGKRRLVSLGRQRSGGEPGGD